MDRGAWWAAVHGVTKSQTWWSDLAEAAAGPGNGGGPWTLRRTPAREGWWIIFVWRRRMMHEEKRKKGFLRRKRMGPHTYLKFPPSVSLECKVGSGKWVKRDHVGTCLTILGLRLHTSTQGTQVQSLVRKLRFPHAARCSQKTREKKRDRVYSKWIWEEQNVSNQWFLSLFTVLSVINQILLDNSEFIFSIRPHLLFLFVWKTSMKKGY